VGYCGKDVTHCYSTGSPSGVANVGGFCGRLSGASIIDSFWDTETSGTATSDGGTGRTTMQMKRRATFTVAGWDFLKIWSISACNDRYPCLLGVTPRCSKWLGNINVDQLYFQHAERMER